MTSFSVRPVFPVRRVREEKKKNTSNRNPVRPVFPARRVREEERKTRQTANKELALLKAKKAVGRSFPFDQYFRSDG